MMNSSLADFLLLSATDVIVDSFAVLLDLLFALNVLPGSTASFDDIVTDFLHVVNTNFHLQQRLISQDSSCVTQSHGGKAVAFAFAKELLLETLNLLHPQPQSKSTSLSADFCTLDSVITSQFLQTLPGQSWRVCEPRLPGSAHRRPRGLKERNGERKS